MLQVTQACYSASLWYLILYKVGNMVTSKNIKIKHEPVAIYLKWVISTYSFIKLFSFFSRYALPTLKTPLKCCKRRFLGNMRFSVFMLPAQV